MTVTTQEVRLRADEIVAETERAMDIFPPIRNAHEGYAVILEELGEFWNEVTINPSRLSEAERAARRESMRKELIQCAAMCLRVVVDLAL